jgi:hypothetical protein
MLAEVFRARGASTPIITPADFSIDDDECGVTTLIDSFATSADQERLREKAIRNLSALKEANIPAPHMREVISSIWVRSLSAVQAGGATRREVQLDLTSTIPVDDNAFTAELAEIVENSFNIHEGGLHEKRYCFRLPENPESKLKAWARNDRAFDPQTAAAPGLMRIGRDQEFLCKFLNHYLKTPDLARELPSQVVVCDKIIKLGGPSIKSVDVAFDYCLTSLGGAFAKRDVFLAISDLSRSLWVLSLLGLLPLARSVLDVSGWEARFTIAVEGFVLIAAAAWLSWARMLRFRELSESPVFNSFLAQSSRHESPKAEAPIPDQE